MIWFFGLNQSMGPLAFTAFTILLSVFMTLVRDRGGSVVAACIFHAAWNAVGSASGWSGFVILALGVAVIALWQGMERRRSMARGHRRSLKNALSNSPASASPMPE